MRKQGLDASGQPVSSYWKARIEAEEGRVRVQELEEEIAQLRSQQPDPSPFILLTQSQEEELVRLRAENAKLRSNSQTKELKSALLEMECAKRTAATKFQEHLRVLQEKERELRKETQEAIRSRDFWKNEAEMLRKSLKDLHASMLSTENEEVIPLGRTPTIRDFLLWVGVRLTEGRVLAIGDDFGVPISIEVKDGSLRRVHEVDIGVRKSFQTVALSDSVPQLVSIFFPYKSYCGYQTDPRILEAFRILGRPLTTM